MEVLFSIIVGGCFTYLISEVNGIQEEIKEIRSSIVWIQVKLDRRRERIESDSNDDHA